MGQLPRLLSAGVIGAAVTFLLLLIPVSANTCMIGCHGLRAGKGHVEGTVYSYAFEGTSTTAVSEAQGASTVQLSATVELSVKPDCIRQVKLKNLLVNGSPASQKDVEQHALQFNYHEGHIDTSVCSEPQDSQVSLNIKRAIVSLFQTSVMQDSGVTMHRETDVFGNCETSFEFRKEGEKLTVRKRKNLSSCSHREHLRHGLFYSTHDHSSDIQTSPVLDSQQEIEQIYDKGVLNSVKSTETYVYKPFTNGDAGAKTIIESKLSLKSTSADGQSTAPVSVPKSLVFEAPHPVVESSPDAILKSLKSLKESSKPEEIKSGAAEKFGDLIKVLRKSNKNDILAVYQRVKAGGSGFDKNYDRKILLDALYRTGTGEAAEVAVELIKKRELSNEQKLGYLASLSLVDHVNLPAVTAVVSLLDDKDMPRIGYLGIGNVIGKYCRDHECENVPEVKAALEKISSKIHNGKPENRKSENEIIAAFKALGNAKYLDDQTIDKMVKIVKDKGIPNRVRVAAIEALPAKCTMKWKTPLLDVFGDREEDSEIRLKIYLSLVACPCAPVANAIKDVLDKETVNQVGSFITTHLKNLRASTDPSKANAKKYFEEIRPRKKFPIDFRKFSFNNELSYKIDKLGVGSTLEQNVIYSQKSWIPRSTSLNLTSEIFGRSFNFLEIDTRVENLDRLIEHYFGPKGVIKRSDINDLINDGKTTFSDVYGRVKERLDKLGRGRRAALNYGDIEKFTKNIESNDDNELDDNLDIDISIKMFGLELAFLDLRDTNIENEKSTSTVDKIFRNINEALNHAKNFDYSVSKHLNFMDIDLIYPTGLGFPLSVGIEGNSVTNIKSNGKIDVQSIMKDPKNAVIKIGLEPSASITIAASLTIDTFGIENGLKVIGEIHTSTGSDLSLKMLDGNGFDVSFGVPKRKQEIISVSSQVILIDKNGLKTPVKFSKGKEHSDCFDQFSTILGLTICGHFAYPYESIGSIEKRPFFPVSGPAKFALSVENNDATSYRIRAFYDKSKDNYRSVEVLFETPNSRNNRKVLLRVEGSNEPSKKYVRAIFDSPFKHADGKLALENSDKAKTLTLTLKHDNDDYYGSVGIVANGNKYKPILEYKVPDHIEKLAGGKGGAVAAYKLDGDITVNEDSQGKKYVFEDVTLFAHDKKLASLDGSVLTGPRALVVDAKMSHKEENVHLKFDGRINDLGFDVNMALVPSKNPHVGFQLVWHYQVKNEEMDHSFVFTYGRDLQSKINRVSLIEHRSFKKNDRQDPQSFSPLARLKCKSEITWPAENFNVKLETDLSPQNFETEMDFQYGKFKLGTDIEIKIDEASPSNWEIELSAYLIESKLALSAKHQKLSDNKRKFEGKLEIPGGKYEADVSTLYQVEGHNANIGLESEFKFNGKKMEVNYGFEMNPQKLNSHALVSFDNAKYLDFLLKGTRGASPHGEFNLLVKKIIIIAGQFTYQNGKGTSTLNIELPRFERKIKSTGSLTITGTRHIANIEVLLDAEKDPNKRIKISTDSDLSKTKIDTKNVIEILSYKLEINGVGKLTEKQENSRDFEGKVDLLLPNGRYFIATGKGSANRAADKSEISAKYELLDHENKGGPSRKISYEYDLVMSQPEHDDVDSKQKISLVNYDNKNLILAFGTKYAGLSHSTGAKRVDVFGTASGSYLPREFKLSFTSDNEAKQKGSWKLDSSLGDDLSVKAGGNYFHGCDEGKPSNGDVSLALVLPNEKLRNLKYEGKSSLLLPHDGSDEFSYSTVQSVTYNDDKTVSGKLNLQSSGFQSGPIRQGKGGLELVVLQNPALIISADIKHDSTGELKKADGSLNVDYGNKKIALNLDATYKLDLSHLGMNVKAKTPTEKLRDVEIGFERNVDKNNHGAAKYNVHMITDGKKYDVTSEFAISKNGNNFNLILTCPDGKTEISSIVNILGDNEYKGEWKIKSPKGFVVADGHLKLENIDDFTLKLNFDSDKIKERKIHAEITSNPAVKTGKKIVITVTSDGKNIITGSTNYNKRDEGGNVIVEGSGNLKIGDNTKSSRFIYSRKQLTRDNDGEIGVFITLNANFGPSAVIGEFKLSDKEVYVFDSFCEQGKDCAHFKVQSVLNADRESRMNHQITVEVDLKKFYVPVEFGLKTTTKYHPKELTLDHTANLYLHTSKDKTQYSSHIYVTSDESGVVLTVPNREFALITSVNVPKGKTPVGPYKIDVSAYLDRKNHPNDKTSFIASGDISADKNSAGISGEARFIYPAQTKDMIIKGKIYSSKENYLDANVDFDVFAKKTQKINVVARLVKNPMEKGYSLTGLLDVNSRGQQLKVELKNNLVLSSNEIDVESSLSYNDKNQKPKTIGVFLTGNGKKINFKVQGPNNYLIRSDSTIELAKNVQKIESKHQILDNPVVVVSIEARDFNSVKYQSYQQDKPDTKLIVNGRVVSGQVAEIIADSLINGEKKNLLSIGVYLDENRFLKPNFVYNKDNVAYMVDLYREKLIKYAGMLKDAAKEINDEAITEFTDLFEHLKKSQPNWKPVIDYYQRELTKLKEEISNDKTLHEILDAYTKIFGGVTTAVVQTIKELMQHLEVLHKQLHEIMDKMIELIKSTTPRIKESLDKICKALLEITDSATKLGATYIKAVLTIINEHQKELKELLTLISELLHDVAKILSKGINQIESEIKNFLATVSQQIKSLPIKELLPLKNIKWADIANYQIPESVLMPIEEAFVQLTKLLPTEELRQFATVTYNYLLKLVKHQAVDEHAELKNIYTHGIDALRSIIGLLQQQDISQNLYELFGGNLLNQFHYLKKLPGIPTLKLSIVNLIKNGELPNIKDIYYTYRPTAYVSDIMPPFSKMGIVVDGGHFFTFDGRHLTMAGACDYVLAHDTRDGNFTIIGSFNSGRLISLTIVAPSESITLKSNGNILVDDKPAEYPASTKNLHAFLTPPIVNVKSDYGVHVACSQKAPMICSIYVSGFYHGRLRGILGDADNEPYDDFTLPTGSITEKESAFGNAYRVNPSCPSAPAVESPPKRNPTCTSYFTGSGSSMSSCFNYVSPVAFRQACDNAMVSGSPQDACLISAAYYAACRKERVDISIPSACGACKVNQDSIAVGDGFSVKIPSKEADIVFVIEQSSKNEKIYHDLIVPLMAEVKSEFKHHGIGDVHIGLIGFGDHMKWPQHYTTGGSTNVNGEVKNMKFAEATPKISYSEAREGNVSTRLQYLKQRVDVELGTFKLTDAYEEAIRYPFRTGSAKVVVGILASSCEKSPLPLSLQQARLFMGQKVYRELGLTYHHIGFLNDILVSGKMQKNVVGYDSVAGYTFADSKNKPLEGSIDKNNLVLTSNDVCAGFAVSSGGAAFSSNHFLEAKQNQRKLYLQVAARRIVDGAANIELKEDCVCKQQSGLNGYASCKIVGRKEKKSLGKQAKG